MTKYRRVIVSQHGGPNVLQVVEDTLPEPQPGEVRVRILAAGVSFADVLMREGIHPEAVRPPFTLGWELVGVVDKHGASRSEESRSVQRPNPQTAPSRLVSAGHGVPV